VAGSNDITNYLSSGNAFYNMIDSTTGEYVEPVSADVSAATHTYDLLSSQTINLFAWDGRHSGRAELHEPWESGFGHASFASNGDYSYVAIDDILYYSSNNSLSWSARDPAFDLKKPTGLWLNSDTVILQDSTNDLRKSLDSGLSWSVISNPFTTDTVMWYGRLTDSGTTIDNSYKFFAYRRASLSFF